MTDKGAVVRSSSDLAKPQPAEDSPQPGAEDLGTVLRGLRAARGLQQKYVAISTGLTQEHLCKLEKGRSLAGPKALIALAGFYDVPIALFGFVSGAALDVKLTPAQQIADHLLVEIQKLVVELDAASEEVRGNKKLRALVESAKQRAEMFLLVVKRARRHAFRTRVQAKGKGGPLGKRR